MSGFSLLQDDGFSPQQAMQLVARTGEKKASIRVDKFIYNSLLAGALLGFGCAASLVVGSSPWYNENAPGVESLLAGFVFPVGLIAIALTGAELWTSTIFVRSPKPHLVLHELTVRPVHERSLLRAPRHPPEPREDLVALLPCQSRRDPVCPVHQLHLRGRLRFGYDAAALY